MRRLLRRLLRTLSPARRPEATTAPQVDERYSVYVHLLHPEIPSREEARRALEALLQPSPFAPARPIKAHPQEGLVLYCDCSLQEIDALTQLLADNGFDVVL